MSTINEQFYVNDKLAQTVEHEVYEMKGQWMEDVETTMGGKPIRIDEGVRTPENNSTITFTVTNGSKVRTAGNQHWFSPNSHVVATITPSANLLSNFTEGVIVKIDGVEYDLGKIGSKVNNVWTPKELTFDITNADHRITIFWDHTLAVENFRLCAHR